MFINSQSGNNQLALKQRGFSLVEIMVGLVIGAIAMLVIMQVFANFEGQKRTTTGSADAQTNGSIALYNIQRDVQMGGFGLPIFDEVNSPMRCVTGNFPLLVDIDNDPATDPETVNFGIFPIAIDDGGNDPGASDTITVRYSRSNSANGIPVTIINTTTGNLNVASHQGCQPPAGGVKDIALISNGVDCALRYVESLIGGEGSGSNFIELDDMGDPVISTNSSVSCLGDWRQIQYRVVENQLMRNDTSPEDVPSVADIVNLQAQYGVSNAAQSNQVVSWVNADALDVSVIDNRNRIKAVRIAVTARNNLLGKENVTTACSSTTTANPTGLCAWAGTVDNPAPTIDLSNDENWQRYRYRVFETIIPLRNLIWSKGAL